MKQTLFDFFFMVETNMVEIIIRTIETYLLKRSKSKLKTCALEEKFQ